MKERTRQRLMRIYERAVNSGVVSREDWTRLVTGAMVGDLVERADEGFGLEKYLRADETVVRFMSERGHRVESVRERVTA